MIDDEKLIKGCKANKSRAQRQLYEKYAPKMYVVCLRYSNSKEEAEDVMHDAFLKIYSAISKFRGDGVLEAWMRRIMVNTALSQLKKNAKFQTVNIDDYPIIQEEDSQKIDAVSPEKLIEEIQKLPTGYRSVLNMFVFEKYSHKEIAETLGITENTSRSQFSKAKILLRKRLEERMKYEKLG